MWVVGGGTGRVVINSGDRRRYKKLKREEYTKGEQKHWSDVRETEDTLMRNAIKRKEAILQKKKTRLASGCNREREWRAA